MKEPAKKKYYRDFFNFKKMKSNVLYQNWFLFFISPLLRKWIYIQVDN
jgi:hypothetical protein